MNCFVLSVLLRSLGLHLDLCVSDTARSPPPLFSLLGADRCGASVGLQPIDSVDAP